VDQGLDGPLEAGLDAEVRGFLGTLRTEDAGEGIQAFLQKRPPEFKGR
jgi:enoyl-CoA hydratase/carnithine racemase